MLYIENYGFFTVMVLLIIALMIAVLVKKREEQDLLPQIAGADSKMFDDRMDEDYDNVKEIEIEEKSQVKKQIEKFVKQKPEAVAQLLRNWLTDEWD